ncbi:MAG: hypothetical protein H6706_22420 [Myxococcales bacterium]|nr:hypothetical protein [Myxococcales bacterium]
MKLALALAAVALTGCGALLRPMLAPPATVEKKLLGTPRAAVPAPAVQVFSTPQELPPGFFFQQRQQAGQLQTKLWALPDWPTAAAPHQVIAAFGWTGGAYGELPDDVIAQAAALGATGVLRLPSMPVAYAVWVSDAPAATAWPEPAALLAEVREKSPDFNTLGEKSEAPMASAAPLALPVKRGRCYAVAFALSPDAAWGDAALRMVTGQVESPDALIGNRSLALAETYTTDDGFEMKAPYHGKPVRLRSGLLDVGCAWADGTVAVGLEAAGRSSALGTGQVHFQVVSHATDEAALAQRKAERDVAMARAQAEAAEAARREAEQARQAAEQRAREAEQRARTAERQAAARPAAPSGPGHYSLSLKNECPSTVRLFEGDKPKFGSGTYSTIGANNIRSFSGFAGKTIWIVDASDNGVSSYSLSAGRHDLVITRSCSGFARR